MLFSDVENGGKGYIKKQKIKTKGKEGRTFP
jgi:hypothetical protein